MPQAAVASWLNCWAVLREPPAVGGSEVAAVCSALVQLGALVCIPWLLSAALAPAEVLVHSSSHRWPQTSNQEQQVAQSRYKVI